jgi:ABC-type Fe3+-hydroxamate transport system substrate-binding protein
MYISKPPIGKPQRIVSLVPSLTELLHSFNLEEAVVGITKFCIHPDSWFRQKSRIGGTKNPDLERINALEPDLIIVNQEENNMPDVRFLAKSNTVWLTNVHDYTSALSTIRSLGLCTNREREAEEIVASIEYAWKQLKIPFTKPKRVLYLIWRNPYMSIGKDTFIYSILEKAGFQHVLGNKKRYPEITLEEIVEAEPDYVFLSSEPYPFRTVHIDELRQQLPNTAIHLVDGEAFSWYGSRMMHIPAYLSEQLYPALSSF